MDTFIQVVTTVETRQQADQLASTIIDSRLAACAQVAGPITSTYWWRDKLQCAEEWQIVFKTVRRAYPTLEASLKRQHPYEVPEIVAIPLLSGNPAYLDWIAAQVVPADGG